MDNMINEYQKTNFLYTDCIQDLLIQANKEIASMGIKSTNNTFVSNLKPMIKASTNLAFLFTKVVSGANRNIKTILFRVSKTNPTRYIIIKTQKALNKRDEL